MRKLQLEFLDRHVQVSLTSGAVTGLLEAVDEDGSLLLRQGRQPVWIPLGQVRYVALLEERPPLDEPDEPVG
jgi:hypothetical protein